MLWDYTRVPEVTTIYYLFYIPESLLHQERRRREVLSRLGETYTSNLMIHEHILLFLHFQGDTPFFPSGKSLD